jgi:hypothetical protein
VLKGSGNLIIEENGIAEKGGRIRGIRGVVNMQK